MDGRTGLPRVGMVGGGQLARMTHQAAIALGQSLRILATSPDDSAALISPDVQIGEPDDLAALRLFAADCDVLTLDHEHVLAEHLRVLRAEGHRVFPSPEALLFAQDKAAMRRKLQQLGAPIPPFVITDVGGVETTARSFGDEHGWPVVVKTASGGYDGRGVFIVQDPEGLRELAEWLPASDSARKLVLEAFVVCERELAVLLARSPFGQAAQWPVVQTVQHEGICVEVIAPAPGLDDGIASAAGTLGLRLAAELGVVGVLAVELFQVPVSRRYPDGLVVNELAMRPHNSGHWTMDGATTSQFEQHLRAVLDYPLGRTETLAPFTVMANVLGGPADSPGAAMSIDERIHHLGARFPEVKIHWYGKVIRPGRKLGHVNITGSDLPQLRRAAQLAAGWLGSGDWADGYDIHQADSHDSREIR